MQDKLKWSFELESWLSNVLNSISDLAKPVLIDTDSNELKASGKWNSNLNNRNQPTLPQAKYRPETKVKILLSEDQNDLGIQERVNRGSTNQDSWFKRFLKDWNTCPQSSKEKCTFIPFKSLRFGKALCFGGAVMILAFRYICVCLESSGVFGQVWR